VYEYICHNPTPTSAPFMLHETTQASALHAFVHGAARAVSHNAAARATKNPLECIPPEVVPQEAWRLLLWTENATPVALSVLNFVQDHLHHALVDTLTRGAAGHPLGPPLDPVPATRCLWVLAASGCRAGALFLSTQVLPDAHLVTEVHTTREERETAAAAAATGLTAAVLQDTGIARLQAALPANVQAVIEDLNKHYPLGVVAMHASGTTKHTFEEPEAVAGIQASRLAKLQTALGIESAGQRMRAPKPVATSNAPRAGAGAGAGAGSAAKATAAAGAGAGAGVVSAFTLAAFNPRPHTFNRPYTLSGVGVLTTVVGTAVALLHLTSSYPVQDTPVSAPWSWARFRRATVTDLAAAVEATRAWWPRRTTPPGSATSAVALSLIATLATLAAGALSPAAVGDVPAALAAGLVQPCTSSTGFYVTNVAVQGLGASCLDCLRDAFGAEALLATAPPSAWSPPPQLPRQVLESLRDTVVTMGFTSGAALDCLAANMCVAPGAVEVFTQTANDLGTLVTGPPPLLTDVATWVLNNANSRIVGPLTEVLHNTPVRVLEYALDITGIRARAHADTGESAGAGSSAGASTQPKAAHLLDIGAVTQNDILALFAAVPGLPALMVLAAFLQDVGRGAGVGVLSVVSGAPELLGHYLEGTGPYVAGPTPVIVHLGAATWAVVHCGTIIVLSQNVLAVAAAWLAAACGPTGLLRRGREDAPPVDLSPYLHSLCLDAHTLATFTGKITKAPEHQPAPRGSASDKRIMQERKWTTDSTLISPTLDGPAHVMPANDTADTLALALARRGKRTRVAPAIDDVD
jgi:hypothetical protein